MVLSVSLNDMNENKSQLLTVVFCLLFLVFYQIVTLVRSCMASSFCGSIGMFVSRNNSEIINYENNETVMNGKPQPYGNET